ncbi:MAG: hypothetical protein ABL930_13310 [Pseudobdellovibrio sp.]
MKKPTPILGLLSILFSFLTAAMPSMASAQYLDTKQIRLSEGQCYSNPTSKVYLRNLKGPNATLNMLTLRQAIDLSQLNDTAQAEYYFCQVTCQLGNKIEKTTWVTLSNPASSHNDMNGFICSGVSMEQAPIAGTSLSAIAPVIYPFSAFESNHIEIQNLLKSQNYKMSDELKKQLTQKMNATFILIGNSYMSANSQPMNTAGATLLYIGKQSSGYEAVLKHYTDILKKLNNKVTADFNSAEYFILNAIQAHGKHFNY